MPCRARALARAMNSADDFCYRHDAWLGFAPGTLVNPERDPFLDPADPLLGPQPVVQSLAIEAGVTWWRDAADIVRLDPLRWILSAVIFVIVCAATVLIPLVGALALHVVQTVMIGGLCLGCRDVEAGRPFEVGMIFAGFRSEYLSRLALMALTLVAAFFVLFLVAGMLGVVITLTEFNVMNQLDALPALLPSLLILTLVLTLFLMLYWFAPALIVLHGVGPIESLRLSFLGSLKNISPMLAFGIVGLLALVLGILTAGFGFLLIAPVAIATIYTSTRSVFAVPASDAR